MHGTRTINRIPVGGKRMDSLNRFILCQVITYHKGIRGLRPQGLWIQGMEFKTCFGTKVPVGYLVGRGRGTKGYLYFAYDLGTTGKVDPYPVDGGALCLIRWAAFPGDLLKPGSGVHIPFIVQCAICSGIEYYGVSLAGSHGRAQQIVHYAAIQSIIGMLHKDLPTELN